MGVERLIEEIERGAAQDVERTIAGAEEEAKRRAAERTRDTAAAGAELAARREALAADLSRAELDARQRELVARAALLDRVYRGAVAALGTAHARDDVRAALPHMVEAALACTRAGAALSIRVHPAMADEVRRLLGDRPATITLDASLAPGVVVGDGRATIDSTLRAALDRAWPAIAVALAQEVAR